MPLPTFKTREEIPAGFEDSYIEKDGEFVPDIEDVSSLKSAHERQKEENRKLKAAIAEREKAEREKAEADKAKAAGVTDEQLAKIRAEIAAEKAPLEEEIKKYQTELRTLKLDTRVKQLMLDAGIKSDKVDAVYRLKNELFDLNDSGSPVVKDNPATDLAKFVKTIAEKEFPEWTVSAQKAGTDARGSSAPAGAATEQQEKLLLSNPSALLEQANAAAK